MQLPRALASKETSRLFKGEHLKFYACRGDVHLKVNAIVKVPCPRALALRGGPPPVQRVRALSVGEPHHLMGSRTI